MGACLGSPPWCSLPLMMFPTCDSVDPRCRDELTGCFRQWMPPVLLRLSRNSSDPMPISATVRKTFAEVSVHSLHPPFFSFFLLVVLPDAPGHVARAQGEIFKRRTGHHHRAPATLHLLCLVALRYCFSFFLS